MASLMTVFYKKYLHSDFDIKRHKKTFFSFIPWILPVYLHLLPVFFCSHSARAAASEIESGTHLEGIDTAYLHTYRVCFINIWEVSSLLHSVQHRKLDATTIFLKTTGAIDQYMKSTSVSEHFDGNVEQTVMMCGRLQVRPIKRSEPCTSLLTHSLVLRFIWLGGTMEKWVEVSPSLTIHCWIFHRKRSYDPCSEPHQLLSALFSFRSLPQQPCKFPSSSPKIKLSRAPHSTTQQVLHNYSGCQ